MVRFLEWLLPGGEVTARGCQDLPLRYLNWSASIGPFKSSPSLFSFFTELDNEEDETKLICEICSVERSYLVIKAKEAKLVKEAKACDVSFVAMFLVGLKLEQCMYLASECSNLC